MDQHRVANKGNTFQVDKKDIRTKQEMSEGTESRFSKKKTIPKIRYQEISKNTKVFLMGSNSLLNLPENNKILKPAFPKVLAAKI